MQVTPDDHQQRHTGKVLAIESSGENYSVAAGDLCIEGRGASQASAQILPAVQHIMAELQWKMHELDAIAYGRGPGAFTGLRTACATVQGLAFAHKTPVLAVDTLLQVAYAANLATGQTKISAVLDARMAEAYTAHYDFATLAPPWLAEANTRPVNELAIPAGYQQAGDIGGIHMLPHAKTLLQIAPTLIAHGYTRPAAQALPYYVRNKVALTTDERKRPPPTC